MFGEMIGVWLMTAFKNYDGLKIGKGATGITAGHAEIGLEMVQDQGDQPKNGEKKKAKPRLVPEHLQSINLIEVGPGTGLMMCDILRTIKQFTGNLRNVQVVLVEASENLRKTQQDKLLKFL